MASLSELVGKQGLRLRGLGTGLADAGRICGATKSSLQQPMCLCAEHCAPGVLERRCQRFFAGMTEWGVSPTTLGRLQAAGVPYALLSVLQYVVRLHGPVQRDLDLVEMFSGCGQLVKQFRLQGMSAIGYDRIIDPDTNDLCSCPGFIHAVYLVRFPKPSL